MPNVALKQRCREREEVRHFAELGRPSARRLGRAESAALRCQAGGRRRCGEVRSRGRAVAGVALASAQDDGRDAGRPGRRSLRLAGRRPLPGAAFLDVETAAALDCPLELPPGFELLQFTVDGLPVDAVRRPAADDGTAATWVVPLGLPGFHVARGMLFFAASAIPQSLPGWPRRCSFVAPKLGDLPVERTVWTIAAPRTFQAAGGKRGQIQFLRSTVGFQGAAAEKMDLTPLRPRFRECRRRRHCRAVAAFRRRRTGDRFFCRPAVRTMLSHSSIGPSKPRHGSRGWRASPAFLVIVGLAGLVVRLGLLRNLVRPLACCLRRRLRAGMVAVVVAQRGGFAYRAGRVVVPIPAAETTWEAGSGCRLNAR